MVASPQTQSALRERIRKVGSVGRILCTVILVSDALTGLLVIANALFTRKGISPFFFVMLIFWIMGVLIMRQLFVMLTRQQLFTPQSARLLQWLGVWQLVWGFRISHAADKVSDIAFGYQIEPGLVLNFKPEFILTGLFLLAFGWAMNLAATLQQEQDLTV